MRKRRKLINDVEIIDIGDKGNSLGRTPDGEIVLVDGAVPGDIIDAQILRKKKGLKFGRVALTKVYSQFRVEPTCEHFGVCGGCKWQNLNYTKQLELKENAVKAAIRRIANDDESKVAPIVGSERQLLYRNKLEYAFSNKRWITEEEVNSGVEIENRAAVGFHRAGAFDKVVDIENCLLQESLTNDIRNFIREYALKHNLSFYYIRNNEGFLRNLIVRNTLDGQWMICVIFGHEDDQIKPLLSSLIEEFPSIQSGYYFINPKPNDSIHDLTPIHFHGETKIVETLGQLKCQIGPKSFFQTNPAQAEVLYSLAMEYADLEGNEVVYDLYTGTGTIAMYASQFSKKVVGIEQIAEAISDAKENANLNNISNCEFLVGDVKDVLSTDFHQKYGRPDVIITDPPRAGMHKDVVETILQLESPKVVYISCNPSTQARDIQILKSKYDLIKCIPVDMFPHTSHIENVALLHLKS